MVQRKNLSHDLIMKNIQTKLKANPCFLRGSYKLRHYDQKEGKIPLLMSLLYHAVLEFSSEEMQEEVEAN